MAPRRQFPRLLHLLNYGSRLSTTTWSIRVASTARVPTQPASDLVCRRGNALKDLPNYNRCLFVWTTWSWSSNSLRNKESWQPAQSYNFNGWNCLINVYLEHFIFVWTFRNKLLLKYYVNFIHFNKQLTLIRAGHVRLVKEVQTVFGTQMSNQIPRISDLIRAHVTMENRRLVF
jgi:hypothetical protein